MTPGSVNLGQDNTCNLGSVGGGLVICLSKSEYSLIMELRDSKLSLKSDTSIPST